jgi:hypothetical protein
MPSDPSIRDPYRTRQKAAKFQNVHPVLDLISADDPTNVHAGEVEVRPPGAPTAGPIPSQRQRTSAVGAGDHRHRFHALTSRGGKW